MASVAVERAARRPWTLRFVSLSPTLKSVFRHAMMKCGMAKLHIKLRAAFGYEIHHLSAGSLPARFSAIYRDRVWLMGRESGSLSGIGSELKNTESVRKRLPDLLREISTKTLLDLGCGDFNWMKEIELGCHYIGVDIVEELIASNTASYTTEIRTFKCLDATRDILPSADAVLCREMLFHLSFEDIWRVIGNVCKSDAHYFIATNDNALCINAEIISGDYRPLNLHRKPFEFPTPAFSLRDDSIIPGRILAAWRVADLRESIRAGIVPGRKKKLAIQFDQPPN